MSRRAATHISSLIVVWCALAVGACARRLVSLPEGPGTPAPAAAASAYAEATDQCRRVRTMTASLSLSGRAADTRLRLRVDAGLAEPGQVRLEGLSPVPFGRPVFILVSPEGRSADATLVFPRDRRVISEGSAEAIIEALTGIALTPDELRTILSGCGLGAGVPSSGRAYDGGWMALEQDGSTSWLRQADGAWRTRAVVRGPLEIRYDEFDSFRPSRIRLRTSSTAAIPADITLRVSDVDINVPLGPDVFRVNVPEGSIPMTVAELRRHLHNGER